MPKRTSRDINVIATSVVQKATTPIRKKIVFASKKNPAAVSLGRLGGLKGGKARAMKLSATKRKEIAQKAAQARWSK